MRSLAKSLGEKFFDFAIKLSPSYRFPYKFLRTNRGKSPYPTVSVTLFYRNRKMQTEFLVDTGSDVTVVPVYIAEYLKLDLSKLPVSNSRGVSGELTQTRDGQLRMTIGDKQVSVKVSFVESDEIPPLLGRKDIFDKFDIFFDNKRQETVFVERRR